MADFETVPVGWGADDVQGHVSDDGHVSRSVAGPEPHRVVVEDDVEHPVQPVLDVPVAAHHMGEGFGVELGRGEIGSWVRSCCRARPWFRCNRSWRGSESAAHAGHAGPTTSKGADDLPALRDNWPTLVKAVRLFFDTAPKRAFDALETADSRHGRIEARRHRVSHEVGWFATSRRFPGEPRFPGLKAIARVEAEVERDRRVTVARRLDLSSAPLDTKHFARAVRTPWDMKIAFTGVMDVVFHDDLMRLGTEHGPANLATIKHAALNLIRANPDKASLAVRRKTAAWDDRYLFAAITRSAP